MFTSYQTKDYSELEFYPVDISSLRGRKVRPKDALLIEDSQETRFQLSQILQKMGFRVQSASTVWQARLLLHEMQVDLILCEVDLPDEDSLEFIRQLRLDVQHESTPLVAVSELDVIQEVSCLSAGADMYCPNKYAESLLPSQIALLMEYAANT